MPFLIGAIGVLVTVVFLLIFVTQEYAWAGWAFASFAMVLALAAFYRVFREILTGKVWNKGGSDGSDAK